MDHPEPNLGHLHLALSYVSNAWIPTNPRAVAAVRDGLRQGTYSGDPSLLLRDLKRDFGLFTFLLSRLATNNQSKHDPVSVIIEGLHDGRIAQLIAEGKFPLERRTLQTAADPLSSILIGQLNFAMISATSSECLAEANGFDGSYVFSCALLRQLGLSLVAWNYPHLFERAVFSRDSPDSLEVRLSQSLGFSPSLLAATLASQWGFSTELQQVVAPPDDSANISATAVTLRRICEVGEMLARACDPSQYPTAANDWEDARIEIARRLGPSGMANIYKRVSEQCLWYREELPHTFPILEREQPGWEEISDLTAIQGRKGRLTNRYLENCELALQRGLIEFYSGLSENAVSAAAIRTIATTLTKQAGFLRGCLYLADPTAKTLVPRYGLGELTIKGLQPIFYAGPKAENNIITAAFRARGPIVQEGVLSDNSPIALFTAPLGDEQRIGVLYCESASLLALPFRRPDQDRNRIIEKLQHHFSALREALCQALQLY